MSIDYKQLLLRLKQEVEECMELFQELQTVVPTGSPEELLLEQLMGQQFSTVSETVDENVRNIPIEEAVEKLNEKLKKCLNLINSVIETRRRISFYTISTSSIGSRMTLDSILGLLWKQFMPQVLKHIKTQLAVRQGVKQVETITETPKEFKIDEKLLQEIRKKFESSSNNA